jgi:zinc protease
LSLVVTGDFDVARTKGLIEKYYGSIAPGPPLDRPKHWVAPLNAEKIVEVKDHVPQERTYFAWPSPAFFDSGDAELDLTSLILTDGLSSRLNKSLVYDQQVCSNVVSFQSSMEIAGEFVIWATARPGISLSQIEPIVSEQISRLAKDGPTQAELDRVAVMAALNLANELIRAQGQDEELKHIGPPTSEGIWFLWGET